MVFTILLNKSNLYNNGYKNEYRYPFQSGGLTLSSDYNNYISVAQISIPFSFFNISSVYNNTMYQVIHNGVTYTNNIPDLYADIETLNKNLQYFLVSNNLFLIDSAGNYTYFLEILSNINRYKIEVSAYPVPSSLPTGWTAPSGFVFTGTTMQFVVPSTNNFGDVIGFLPGNYPSSPSASEVVFLSNTEIQVSPINSICLSCNMVNNDISVTPSIFYSFVPPSGSQFGELISISSPELIWISTFQSGNFQELVLSIVDELNRPIKLEDSGIAILLCFKSEPKQK